MEINEGDVVRSRVDAQGMTRGKTYSVVKVHKMRRLGWVFTTVDLMDEDRKTVEGVGNVHLVLDVVATNEECERHAERDC